MKIDEVQSSSQSFSSTKSKITVLRLENIVVLKLKSDGLMVFDEKTGKKLWVIQTAPMSLLGKFLKLVFKKTKVMLFL